MAERVGPPSPHHTHTELQRPVEVDDGHNHVRPEASGRTAGTRLTAQQRGQKELSLLALPQAAKVEEIPSDAALRVGTGEPRPGGASGPRAIDPVPRPPQGHRPEMPTRNLRRTGQGQWCPPALVREGPHPTPPSRDT